MTGFAAAALLAFTFTSCGDDKKTDNGIPPIGGYNTSDEIAASNLVAKFSFENDVNDAKGNITAGSPVATSYVAGAKGQALQGSSAGYVIYSGVSSKVTGIQSTTISTWVKTGVVANGAESWFQLLNDSNWIGNLFVLQESGTAGSDSLRLKFTFNKWDANTAWKEQWVDYANENRLTGIVDKWAHIAFSYDGASSTASVYVNGKKITMPDAVAKRWSNDPTQGGVGLGELQFANANRFIFGAYKQMVDATPDGWMKNFTGNLDEFRIYNKALADADVQALYDLESAGK